MTFENEEIMLCRKKENPAHFFTILKKKKREKFSKKPDDINDRIGTKTIVCYPNNNIEEKNLDILHTARKNLVKKSEILIF